MTDKIEKAIKFIAQHLWNEEDLWKPVLLHSIRVGLSLLENWYNENIVISWFLHDIVEDSNVEISEVNEIFWQEIGDIVLANSKDYWIINAEERDLDLFSRCIKKGQDSIIVKWYDLLDNLKYFIIQQDTPKITRIKKLMKMYLQSVSWNDISVVYKIKNIDQKKSKIIFLNWPCWIWKSTISKKLHEKIEYSLLWDKDSQRRNISHYKDTKEHQKKSWKMIFEMTKKMILFCIENGCNMIFDGIIYEKEIILDMRKFIQNNLWEFVHVHITASEDIWENRINQRGISWSLTIEKAKSFYENLSNIPKDLFSMEINTDNKSEDDVCNEIEYFLTETV